MGNRAVRGSVWAVAEALGRAYPLLLAPGVDAARDEAASLLLGLRSDELLLEWTWIGKVRKGTRNSRSNRDPS